MVESENQDVEEQMEDQKPQDEDNLLVVDPDDYQKNKKLQTIHETKKNVIETRKRKHEWIPELADDYRGNGQTVYRKKLALSVALYASELMPIIEDALDRGLLDESDLVADEYDKVDIQEFAASDGRVREDGTWECPPEYAIMGAFRQIGRIERKLGFGLDIDEEQGPAQI